MKRHIEVLFCLLVFLAPSLLEAGRRWNSWGSGYSYSIPRARSYNYGYKAPRIKSYNYKRSTYAPKVYVPKSRSSWSMPVNREYRKAYYSTTPSVKVKRSRSARQEYLRSQGYERTPSGYEVDHIIPLHHGGADDPSNMQLLPKEIHKRKTRVDMSDWRHK